MKTVLKNVIILFFVIFVPSILVAQTPIDDCGLFKRGVEAGCILFDSDYHGEYLFFGPIGPFEIGDRARIRGMIIFDCISFCMQGNGCIYDGILSECDVNYICGDFNGDGVINILDIVYLINYLYKDGPPPIPLASANVDYDIGQNSAINILDIIRLINFRYKGGSLLVCP